MKKLLDYLIILCITLIACEITLQVWLLVNPPPDNSLNKVQQVFVPDGKSFKLASDFFWKNDQYEIKTNSFGMAWDEISQKKIGVKRIGFYGDSFTAGAWASDYKNAFVGVASRALNSDSIEVLNFGVNGYGVDDIYDRIKKTVDDFEIDYVVLCSFNGNDYRDTYLGFDVDSISEEGLYYFRRRVQENKIPHAYLPAKKKARKETTGFELMLPKFVNNLWRVNPQEKARTNFGLSNNFMSLSFWSRKEQPNVYANAVEQTLIYMDSIDNYLDSLNKVLFIVSIPTMHQVYIQESEGDVYSVAYPQLFLGEYCNSKQIPYLDLLPKLRTYAADKKNDYLYVASDPHFNNLGHQLAGEQIIDFIQTQVTNN